MVEDPQSGRRNRAYVMTAAQYPKHPIGETIFKIVSYCTIIFPILVLLVKIALRLTCTLPPLIDHQSNVSDRLCWKNFMLRSKT
jgi:hypothetical protein